MTGDQIQVLVAMILYLLLIISVGLWYAKRSNQSAEGYFLGGRTLGPWVAAMSAEASDMSGWLLMGLPGVAYFTGFAEAGWTAIGLGLGTYINWKLVSVRLRRYSQVAGNSITLPDFFSNRFRDDKKILMTLASLIILIFFSIYVGSQLVTFGKLFGYVFGVEDYYVTMVIIGGVFVLAYTILGGFLAESTTDFIQGLLMVIALVAVLGGGLIVAGGISGVNQNLAHIDGFLSPTEIAVPVDEAGSSVTASAGNLQAIVNGQGQYGQSMPFGFLSILSCLAWGLGYFGMPHVLLRFMAIKKWSELKKSRRIAVVWVVISLISAVAIGLVGRAVLPDLLRTASASETIFIQMSVKLFPPLLAGIIISGILAAAMSSADSYMLIASSAVAQNIVKGLFLKKATDKTILWIARLTIVLITIFGIFIATSGNDSIFRVVSYAWAGLGAGFGPLILFSLLWKRTNLQGAVAGMVAGGAAVIIWKELLSPLGGVFSIYELLPAFVLSCIVIVAVSLLTAPPSKEIQDDFDRARSVEI